MTLEWETTTEGTRHAGKSRHYGMSVTSNGVHQGAHKRCRSTEGISPLAAPSIFGPTSETSTISMSVIHENQKAEVGRPCRLTGSPPVGRKAVALDNFDLALAAFCPTFLKSNRLSNGSTGIE